MWTFNRIDAKYSATNRPDCTFSRRIRSRCFLTEYILFWRAEHTACAMEHTAGSSVGEGLDVRSCRGCSAGRWRPGTLWKGLFLFRFVWSYTKINMMCQNGRAWKHHSWWATKGLWAVGQHQNRGCTVFTETSSDQHAPAFLLVTQLHSALPY